MNDYSDIINTKYPFRLNHLRMSREHRASQFAPFAALKGYSESIDGANKDAFQTILLDEEFIQEINNKLIVIAENIKNKPLVKITYLKNEEYITQEKRIKKIEQNTLFTIDNEKIEIKDIINIDEKSNK